MRISVTEWSALKVAIRLPRALINPELFAQTLRKHARSRRGMAAIGLALLAVLVFLHVKTADPAVARLTSAVAQLAGAKLIDSRWDAAAVRARSEEASTAAAVQSTDLAYLQRALDAAAAEMRTTAARESTASLRKNYVEKADVLTRYDRASADSRQALAAAMRADAAVTGLVRSAWSEFPQRERLVAAENLAVRVIAEAQRYHHAPTAAHRASLESYVIDLPRVKSLPKPIQSALARLEVDVHQILLLKPLEHMLAERLQALDTAKRLDETSALLKRELDEAIVRRDRYAVALTVYTLALLALLAYLGVRAIARYRDLEVLYAGQTRELAKALHKLKAASAGTAQPAGAESELPDEPDAQVREERRSSA